MRDADEGTPPMRATDLLLPILVVAGWLALQLWVLPRAGVRT